MTKQLDMHQIERITNSQSTKQNISMQKESYHKIYTMKETVVRQILDIKISESVKQINAGKYKKNAVHLIILDKTRNNQRLKTYAQSKRKYKRNDENVESQHNNRNTYQSNGNLKTTLGHSVDQTNCEILRLIYLVTYNYQHK